jgi:hypothetical protein
MLEWAINNRGVWLFVEFVAALADDGARGCRASAYSLAAHHFPVLSECSIRRQALWRASQGRGLQRDRRDGARVALCAHQPRLPVRLRLPQLLLLRLALHTHALAPTARSLFGPHRRLGRLRAKWRLWRLSGVRTRGGEARFGLIPVCFDQAAIYRRFRFLFVVAADSSARACARRTLPRARVSGSVIVCAVFFGHFSSDLGGCLACA